MSKFVKVQTQLRELNLIKRSLDDLKLNYEEDAVYRHIYSGRQEAVPLLVRQGGLKFGLRAENDGPYEVVGDDMALRAIKQIMQRVQQRYAYHKVRVETEKAGFDLVEESVGQDQVIRLTVRRWS
ncbi:MAG: DUF1257 domain-containing protein [Caldilineaceae bacterium]|nr:DUF1257 domain-containing protein [Caldilineaceae bacterium]